jgi:hypothetical protein
MNKDAEVTNRRKEVVCSCRAFDGLAFDPVNGHEVRAAAGRKIQASDLEENMIAIPNALIPDEANTRHFGMAENRMADELRKILLPRRPGEPEFGPPQYYYAASRTGVMPSRHADT